MCDICLTYPCHPNCPNAPEAPVVHHCYMCGEDIREGDCYYEINDEPWCEECIKDCYKVAEREDCWE